MKRYFIVSDPAYFDLYWSEGFEVARGFDPDNYTKAKREARVFSDKDDGWILDLGECGEVNVLPLPEDQQLRRNGAVPLIKEEVQMNRIAGLTGDVFAWLADEIVADSVDKEQIKTLAMALYEGADRIGLDPEILREDISLMALGLAQKVLRYDDVLGLEVEDIVYYGDEEFEYEE